MSTRPGPNSRAVASNHYKRTNLRFTAEQDQWQRVRAMNLQQYEQSLQATKDQVKALINTQSEQIIENNFALDDIHDGLDDEFDPTPTRPRPMLERAPLRSERREGAVRDADLDIARSTSLKESLRLHQEAWQEYRVCPPAWDMTPADYRATSVDCNTSPLVPLAGVSGGMTWVSLAGLGVATAIPGGFSPDATLWLVNGLCGVAGGALMRFAGAAKRRARRRVAELDPREAIVLTSKAAIDTIEALAVPLDDPDTPESRASLDLGGRAERLEKMYETARRLAQGQQAAAGAPSNAATAAAAETAERRRRWTLVLDRFENVDDAWASLLTDPIAVLEHARLLDVSSPATATFIEAHGYARDLIGSRTRDEADVPPMETLREVETAVRAMATAWSDAKVRAQRAGYEWMPEADRTRARRATGFLAQAADKGLDWTARVTYAEKALALMRAIEVVPVPQPILRELAAASALALPPGSLHDSITEPT